MNWIMEAVEPGLRARGAGNLRWRFIARASARQHVDCCFDYPGASR
jgi:hypothetical protein